VKNILITLLAAAALAAGIWLWRIAEQDTGAGAGGAPGAFGPRGFGPQGEVAVEVEIVEMRPFFDAIEAIGTAQANESLTLTAKVADTVRRVHFEDGDLVEGGHVLIEQTSEEESALLDEARANLVDAETQLRRTADLAERRLAPQSELDVAKSRAQAARARLNAIIARIDDRLIRAPFAGLLGFRQVSPGTLVQPGTAITTLDDISVIKLDFSVPEVFLNVLAKGDAVYAQSVSYPGREFSGAVSSVGSRIDPITRAVTVRALIPNADRLLRPGMLMTVKLVTREVQSLGINESAIQQVRNEHFVYVVTDGRAEERRIRIGKRRPGIVEVLDGLSEGERVVTAGIIKIRDGTPVRIVNEVAVDTRGEAVAAPRGAAPWQRPRANAAGSGSGAPAGS
jgi:membrane fusion protein (multidrug efflux system)